MLSCPLLFYEFDDIKGLITYNQRKSNMKKVHYIPTKSRYQIINFLTEYDCILSGERKRVEEIARKYTPYVYGYTVILPQDYFSIDKLPEKSSSVAYKL